MGALGAARAGLLVTLTTFVVLYGWLLVATDFLPYGTDNNESFSSLWHAHNLYHFSFWESAGLTDEAFSPFPEAHPFVHTHQGNVPRLFAFLIYVLGARTVEAQIVVTTLLVGTGTVALAYRLFSRLVNPLFATVACLTLITDYLFFGQWAVVTYRIWHFTFVFGALMCVIEMGGERLRRWAAVTVFLFALIFYYELVFAGFTAVFAGLFAAWRYFRRPRRLMLVWAAQVAGAVIGIGVLAVQLTAHLGAAVALEDFRLTFFARNAASEDPALREYMTAFFMQHNIVFWQNFVDVRTYRTFEQFTLLLTTLHLQWYTPLVVLLSVVLLAGWAAGTVLDRLGAFAHRLFPTDPAAAASRAAGPVSATAAERGLTVVVLLVFGFAFVTLTVLRDEAFLALEFTGESYLQRTNGLGWLVIAGIVGVAALALWNGCRNWRELLRTFAGVSLLRAVGVVALLIAIAMTLRGQAALYLELYRPIWHEMMQAVVPMPVTRAATLILLGLSGALALVGPRRVLGSVRADQFQGLLPYLACGGAAYLAVYLISPGYVYSGYLSRYAPLAVFILNIAVGAAAYLVVAAVVQSFGRLRARHAAGEMSGFRRQVGPVVRTSLLTSGLLFVAGFWVHVQTVQLAVVPPGDYAYLKLLGQPPLRGLSVFSNSYAAPMAAYTGSWGYVDTTLAASSFEPAQVGFDIQRGDGSYIWLRDRDTNPAYARPDLFVCVRPQSMFSVLMLVRGEPEGIEGCGTLPLVTQAAEGDGRYFQHELIARDPTPMDAWAIIRMDWDIPPYLLPFRESRPRNVIDIDRVDTPEQAAVLVKYQFFQPDGAEETGTRFRLEGIGPNGTVCTIAEKTDDPILEIPPDVLGRLQVVVTPSTATKVGQSYTSDRFVVRDQRAEPCGDRELRRPADEE